MTENPQEPSTQGSAKVLVQHTRNTRIRTSRGEAGTAAGIVTQDTTAVQEKILHTAQQEWF